MQDFSGATSATLKTNEITLKWSVGQLDYNGCTLCPTIRYPEDFFVVFYDPYRQTLDTSFKHAMTTRTLFSVHHSEYSPNEHYITHATDKVSLHKLQNKNDNSRVQRNAVPMRSFQVVILLF